MIIKAILMMVFVVSAWLSVAKYDANGVITFFATLVVIIDAALLAFIVDEEHRNKED